MHPLIRLRELLAEQRQLVAQLEKEARERRDFGALNGLDDLRRATATAWDELANAEEAHADSHTPEAPPYEWPAEVVHLSAWRQG